MLVKARLEFKDKKMFEVPFNPARLTLDACAAKSKNGSLDRRGVVVRLRMELIFDKSIEMESVYKETRQFLDAAKDSMDRRAVFHWNKFDFDGYLEQASADYEMFSENGDPVRARIRLVISSRNSSMISKDWYDDYQALFSIKDGMR